MHDAMQATGDGDATSTSGSAAGTSATAACASGWPGRDEWEEFDGHERRAAAARRARQRGRVPHRLRRRDDRHVVPLLRPDDAAVVDLLGRQPALGVLDPPVFGSFAGGVGVFEGDGHVRGAADPRALHWSRVTDADAALGAGLLRRTAARRGRRTGSWTSRARGGRAMSAARRRPARSRRTTSTSPSSSSPAPAVAVGRRPCSSGTTSPGRRADPAPRSRRWRDEPARTRAGRARLAGELGFVILHRCGESFYFLLVSTLAQRERALGDRLGQGRRAEPAFGPWPVDGPHQPTFCVWELARGLPRAGRLEPLPALAAPTRTTGRPTWRTPTPGCA